VLSLIFVEVINCISMNSLFFRASLIIFFCGLSLSASAQMFDGFKIVKQDTNYVRVYKDELTARVYLSRKQNGYNLSQKLASPWLKYRTNDKMILGIGYTYTFLTINVGFKMPFLNQDEEKYGKTSYTDLSIRGIFRSLITETYLQWNKGYYLANPDDLLSEWNPSQGYPLRGDMRSNLIGVNIQYLFNSARYSYKAAFLQNALQKKSAGSPIVGFEGYWMLGSTDSAMVGPSIPPSGYLGNISFNQVDIFNMGINGGYAYTFVWKEKLYLSLSAILGPSVAKNVVHDSNASVTHYNSYSFGFTTSSRFSIGYNSNAYFVGLSGTHFALRNMVWGQGDWFTYTAGDIRLNVVRRFRLKRPIRVLRPDLWIF
jgi:hypothetical protein